VFKDYYGRLRCHASDATESYATEGRQSGGLSLPGKREQIAGQIKRGV